MAKKRGASSKLRTRLELARALNYNPRTLQKFEEEGMPVEVRGRGGRPSQYDENKVRQWIAARQKQSGDGGKLNLFEERAEKEKWQGLLAQQTYLTRQRELLPRLEVEKAWNAQVVAMRTRMLAWPTTIADHIGRAHTLDGVPGIERVLQEAVHDVLLELATPKGSETPVKPRRRKTNAA